MEQPASTTTSSESDPPSGSGMFDIAKTTFELQRTILKGHPGKIRRIIMTEIRRKEQRQQNLPGQLLGDPRPSD